MTDNDYAAKRRNMNKSFDPPWITKAPLDKIQCKIDQNQIKLRQPAAIAVPPSVQHPILRTATGKQWHNTITYKTKQKINYIITNITIKY